MTQNEVPESEFPSLRNDLLLKAARGEDTPVTPVWLHRQAGRFLPEFREVRAKHPFFEVCRTKELACEVTLQPLRRFDLDASIIFSDILVVPQALGMEVLMVKGKGPVVPEALKTPADMERQVDWDTPAEEVAKRLTYVCDAITLTRKSIDGQCPLIGFTGCPFTLMCYMLDGRVPSARRWLQEHPEESRRLLARITEVNVAYLALQVRAGAQMVQLFGSSVGELSESEFFDFVWPEYVRTASEVRRLLQGSERADAPLSVFLRGELFARQHCHVLRRLDQECVPFPFDVVSVGMECKPSEARAALQQPTLQGNLVPECLELPEQELRQSVRDVLDQFGVGKHIFNLGWGMRPHFEPEKVAILVDEVHRHSRAMRLQRD